MSRSISPLLEKISTKHILVAIIKNWYNKTGLKEANMQYHFIINRTAKSGKNKHIWDIIERELIQKQLDYQLHVTKHPYHSYEIAKEICATGKECTIVSIGGDGTVNETLNGLSSFNQVTFGYIPTGSGNDFARGVPIHTDTVKALHTILYPKQIKNMDLGVVYTKDVQRRFGVSMGMGFDALTCKHAISSKFKDLLNMIHLGRLTYVGTALKQLFTYKSQLLSLTLDDGEIKNFSKCLFLTVMNQPYEGGGFMFCPDANNEDGYLDICVVDSIPKWKIFLVFPIAYFGKHTKIKGIHTFRCKKALIHTTTPLPVHTDGEYLGDHTDISVGLYHETLRILSKE